MAASENSPAVADMRQHIAEEIDRTPILIPERGVMFGIATAEQAVPMAALYKKAYDRGDYFAGRYDNPDEQIFDPDWLEQDLSNPGHVRFTFTDSDRRLLGVTAFFHDHNSQAGPLMTSDATQLDHSGRGMRIMDRFFKRVAPVIENSGAGLATDFVLTAESKGLRRTLQTDLGMIAIGIHPHALRHRQLGITRSEISAVKYPHLVPKPVKLLPDFEPLYRIVQSELSDLPEPEIVTAQPSVRSPRFTRDTAEEVQLVDAADPQAQLKAVEDGWQPVEFDPDNNSFKVARFPSERPELDFIVTNEQVPANRMLVRYLTDVLYGPKQPGDTKEGSHV